MVRYRLRPAAVTGWGDRLQRPTPAIVLIRRHPSPYPWMTAVITVPRYLPRAGVVILAQSGIEFSIADDTLLALGMIRVP